jgi:integrin alpha 7
VLLFVKCDSSEVMRIQRSLHGDNFASSFGYSLASADVDGDGRKDLFVGAPFYHKKGAGGAVYFYRNGESGLVGDQERKLMVGSEESRFGFALANGGDINNDGLDDLLVGAPYDSDGGKVFVYMGKRDVGISTKKPDQVISGLDIPSPMRPIRTFGYSLSGGIDMDLNNHSDIAVGAYESDVAVVIRSRPVIDIVTWFGKHPHRIKPDQQGCESDLLSTEVCFVVESCFLIKNFPSNIEQTYIRYVLEAEAFAGGRRPISRIRFGDRNSNSSHYRENIVPIQRNSLTGCFLETGYLKEGTTDLTTPVTFQLSLALEQDEPRPLSNRDIVPNINQYPILNQQEAKRELTIPFQKSCGGDELCNSFLVAKLVVDSNAAAASSPLLPSVLEIQDRQEVVLRVGVENTGEPAYAAVLLLHIDPSFTYVGRSDNQTDITCELVKKSKLESLAAAPSRSRYPGEEPVEATETTRGSSIKCDLGNPYNGMRADQLIFRVVPTLSGEFTF